jgi:predicted RNA-binding Zn-ribbon protein involved in translation (DUF1610 family)
MSLRDGVFQALCVQPQRSVPFNQPNSQSDVKERMQRCRNASSACGQAVIFRCDSARNGMHSHARFSFACYPFGVEPLLIAWGNVIAHRWQIGVDGGGCTLQSKVCDEQHVDDGWTAE